jgi:hypothetical protein
MATNALRVKNRTLPSIVISTPHATGTMPSLTFTDLGPPAIWRREFSQKCKDKYKCGIYRRKRPVRLILLRHTSGVFYSNALHHLEDCVYAPAIESIGVGYRYRDVHYGS